MNNRNHHYKTYQTWKSLVLFKMVIARFYLHRYVLVAKLLRDFHPLLSDMCLSSNHYEARIRERFHFSNPLLNKLIGNVPPSLRNDGLPLSQFYDYNGWLL